MTNKYSKDKKESIIVVNSRLNNIRIGLEKHGFTKVKDSVGTFGKKNYKDILHYKKIDANIYLVFHQINHCGTIQDQRYDCWLLHSLKEDELGSKMPLELLKKKFHWQQDLHLIEQYL